jgi:hypothetical protein
VCLIGELGASIAIAADDVPDERFLRFTSAIKSYQLSPDRTWLVVEGENNASLWSIPSARRIWTGDLFVSVIPRVIHFSADSKLLLIAGAQSFSEFVLENRSAVTGASIWTERIRGRPPTALATAAGNVTLVGTLDGSVHAIDNGNGKKVGYCQLSGSIEGIQRLSRTGDLVLVWFQDGNGKIVKVSEKGVLKASDTTLPAIMIKRVGVDVENRWLALSDFDNLSFYRIIHGDTSLQFEMVHKQQMPSKVQCIEFVTKDGLAYVLTHRYASGIQLADFKETKKATTKEGRFVRPQLWHPASGTVAFLAGNKIQLVRLKDD